MSHTEYIRLLPNADRAVLMVHGIMGTPDHFDFLMAAIPENVSVVNILLDGHGGTIDDFCNSSMAKWQSQVDAWVKKLCMAHKHVLLVGHSMGTLLTASVAEQYPQVDGLLLLNVPLKVWVAPRLAVAALRFSQGKLRPEHSLGQVIPKATGIIPERRIWRYLGSIPRYIELLRLCREGRKVLLHRLALPTVVYQSTDDELVRNASLKAFPKKENLTVHMLPACGHFNYTQEAKAQICQSLKILLQS